MRKSMELKTLSLLSVLTDLEYGKHVCYKCELFLPKLWMQFSAIHGEAT